MVKVVTPDMLPMMEVVAEPAAIPAPAVAAPVPVAVAAPVPFATGLPTSVDAIEPLTVAERRYIEHAIAICGGNLQLASRKLKISASTIYRKKEGWEAE